MYAPVPLRHALLVHHFQGQKVKDQLARGGGVLWRPPAQLVYLDLSTAAAHTQVGLRS